jgi:uncharacterized protein YlzI (FlbEa/FlbD family)
VLRRHHCPDIDFEVIWGKFQVVDQVLEEVLLRLYQRFVLLIGPVELENDRDFLPHLEKQLVGGFECNVETADLPILVLDPSDLKLGRLIELVIGPRFVKLIQHYADVLVTRHLGFCVVVAESVGAVGDEVLAGNRDKVQGFLFVELRLLRRVIDFYSIDGFFSER